MIGNIESFAVIGGDDRQIAVGEGLVADGYNVYAAGFEKADPSAMQGVAKVSTKDAIAMCKNVILPMPAVAEGNCLNAPYADEHILVDDEFAGLFVHGKRIFCGMADRLRATSNIWQTVDVQDYSVREEFAINNAVPTAEGAVAIAMHESIDTIYGSRCLVAGFGRIGKVLCRILHNLGARVTVSARNQRDLAWIPLQGCCAISTENISQSVSDYDLIFNTIPSMIFDREILTKCVPGVIIIDLASAPGGVDFIAADQLNIRAIAALSLPGKVAPRTAGHIIKNTIYNMIKEEK